MSSIKILAREIDYEPNEYMLGFFVGVNTKLGAMKLPKFSGPQDTLKAENIPECLENLCEVLFNNYEIYKSDLEVLEALNKLHNILNWKFLNKWNTP